MKYMLKIMNFYAKLIVCCFCILTFLDSNAEQKNSGTILVLSSYNPDTQRVFGFISEFEKQIIGRDVPYNIYVENLECRGVNDAPLWIKRVQILLERYEQNNLKAVVLLGQEAWASFMSMDSYPTKIPIFACFVSANGVLLSGSYVQRDSLWMPESVDFDQILSSAGRSGGGLRNEYDVKKNIELIRTLHPEVENIAFVSDNTYGGISLQAFVRKEMRQYPDLNLVLIDSRQREADYKQAYASLPSKSAVLLGTWRVGHDGQYLMQSSLTDLININPSIPVFSITRTGMNDVAIGGYVPEYEDGAGDIASCIAESYLDGTVDDSHFRKTGGVYVFDSKKLKEWKIAEYSLPKGSIVEDSVATKLNKYSHYIDLLIIGLVIVVVMLIFVVLLFVRAQRLQRTLMIREGELIVAKAKAEESDMLKSAFLANMSHEIRTPLNAIVGFSSLLESDGISKEDRSEYCSIVLHNSDMLLTLLNDILDVSSLECGKIKFNYSQEDVVQICQHTIMTTAHTRQEGVECTLDSQFESYMMITDAHRLSQVLINLLTNAGKFTSSGSITVAIRVSKEEKMAYFSVTDTGKGIPVDKQDTVFNRFEKLAGNMKKGTGLGLAICRQIVTILGGRIYVDSSCSPGARFVFTHPIDLDDKIDCEKSNSEV